MKLSYKTGTLIILMTIVLLLLLGPHVEKQITAQQDNTAVPQVCRLANIALNETIEIPAQKISQLPVGQFTVVNTTIKLNLTRDSYVVCTPHKYLLVVDNKTLITMILVTITNTTLSLRAPLNLEVKEIQAGGSIEFGNPQKLNKTLYLQHDGEFTIEISNNTLAKSLLRQGLLVKLSGGRSDVYLVLYPIGNSDRSSVNYRNSSTGGTGKPISSITVTPNEWTSTRSGGILRGSKGEGAFYSTELLYAITLIASIATLLYYLTAVRKVESSGY
ncbi:MAG: hypothetical protein GSR76_00630 [Desulfurococcales archaeon]|nr:hypothetical protein [Desulfurococcales archaeon]